ncbi:MAG: hypothetical protein K2X32_01860 [Phycisphaerales bacterium]|nr:hypothetical protein [Phycisphaerales bacterium]
MDYNGEGKWSAASIQSRYAEYAKTSGIVPRDISPIEYGDEYCRRVRPLMEKIIDGIEAGDAACVMIGIEFIEEDISFSFGRLLKKNTARALRRATLTPEQKRRILRRVFGMLERGYVPWEYSEYARLANRIGFASSDIPAVDNTNPYATKHLRYFMKCLDA